MAPKLIIAISPSDEFKNESSMINKLFDAGLYRYHIHKTIATEQSIAEILEGIEPNYLSRITLHSHFHLVLAYGAGGIHYSLAQRTTLGEDYLSKVSLYQSFGVMVSSDAAGDWSPADYALGMLSTDHPNTANRIFHLSKDIHSIHSGPTAILLDEILKDMVIDEIIVALIARS